MSARKMSRREQQALRKQAELLRNVLQKERYCFASELPGIYLCQYEASPADTAAIQTARKLNHAVCVQIYNGKVNFYAVPLETIP